MRSDVRSYLILNNTSCSAFQRMDNDSNRRYTSVLLEEYSHSVTPCDCGLRAIRFPWEMFFLSAVVCRQLSIHPHATTEIVHVDFLWGFAHRSYNIIRCRILQSSCENIAILIWQIWICVHSARATHTHYVDHKNADRVTWWSFGFSFSGHTAD